MDNEDKCVICVTCPVTFSVFFPLCLLCYPLSFCLEKICGKPEIETEDNILDIIYGTGRGQNKKQSERHELPQTGDV